MRSSPGPCRDYAIVVTRNRKHFQPSANNARRGRASDPPRHWGLLLLDCDEPEEEHRVRELADAIEQEAHYAASRYPKGLLLHMHIHNTFYTFYSIYR